MQFSENWLRTLCNPALDSDALGHLLTMAGLEVEESVAAAPAFEGVVVARIVEAEKHPDADKLRVCKVDAGKAGVLQIVCGAPNAAVGLLVPCATIGAVLPGDFRIKAAKLRGVPSQGMLCSGRELGLSDDHGGLLELPADAPVGCDLRDFLALDDTLYTIKLTPNRADCLSLLGVAREVAALTGTALCLPPLAPVAVGHAICREIVLDAPEACPRYCGRVLTGVDARAATPDWMRERLRRSGIRSISALVDITNYVMLELGQPLHVFDNRKLSGAIHVRWPQDRESLRLLNEQTIVADPDVLLIADASRALALAGVMGGEESGVTLETTDVFLESAFFSPDAIAGRARRYGFGSDASHRFERGVDFALARTAMERASALILSICGGMAGPVTEAVSEANLPQRPPVRLRPERLRRLLGIALDDATIARLLRAEHLEVRESADGFQVTPPSWRFDIAIEEDLVEEVVRLHGYDNLPAPEPQGKLAMLPVSEDTRSVWAVRHLMAALDFQEVVTYAFVEEGWERDFCANRQPIRLANPIASQMSVMRSSLIGGLIGNLAHNRKRQQTRVRTFEIGRVFSRTNDEAPVPGFDQPLRLAALSQGPVVAEQWGAAHRAGDFFDLKGDLEALFLPARLAFVRTEHPALHPGRAAAILLAGQQIGILGELHPRWVQSYELGTAPVLFELSLDSVLAARLPAYQEISRQPSVTRDLALVVDADTGVDAVLAVLRQDAAPIVRSVELFDLYQGKGMSEGKKSLAFRVLLQDTQRTLEDAEVESAVQAMIERAAKHCGAVLRN